MLFVEDLDPFKVNFVITNGNLHEIYKNVTFPLFRMCRLNTFKLEFMQVIYFKEGMFHTFKYTCLSILRLEGKLLFYW